MARHFDPLTLKLFIAVCEEGNIARAAEREAIVASAVSKRIAAIEAEVGAPLLVRGRRGIEPTAAGGTLLRQARQVLGAMERMHAELSEFASGVQGTVRVVASISALAGRLPDDIASFLAQHPAVRVQLDERLSLDALRAVREGGADLAVLWDAADLTGLQATPYRHDHLAVALPPGHPLQPRKRLRYADTLAHPAVGVAPGGLMDALLRRQAALLGITPNHRVQVSSFDAVCRIVAAGLGLAILPAEATAPFLQAAGIKLVPLAEPWATRRFVVASRAEGAGTASARALLAHLKACAASPSKAIGSA